MENYHQLIFVIWAFFFFFDSEINKIISYIIYKSQFVQLYDGIIDVLFVLYIYFVLVMNDF